MLPTVEIEEGAVLAKANRFDVSNPILILDLLEHLNACIYYIA